jgi:2-polyprenyl-3-methyl-5-hydroxy-6-metoxy-1,4-benzoquinol methylase
MFLSKGAGYLMDKTLIHSNILESGSKFAADFDYMMHNYCLKKFKDQLYDLNCLELGCYHGEMTKKLSKICDKVTALDFDGVCVEKTIETCINYENVFVEQGDFFTYQNYSKHDVIYFSHSLEHVENDKKLLEIIFNQMKKDAILITIVPNGHSLSRRIAVKMGLIKSELVVTDFEKKIGHFHTYNMNTFEELFKSCNFSHSVFGGIMPKIFSNNQFDQCLEYGIIDDCFLDALNVLSDEFIEICASIYSICKR